MSCIGKDFKLIFPGPYYKILPSNLIDNTYKYKFGENKSPDRRGLSFMTEKEIKKIKTYLYNQKLIFINLYDDSIIYKVGNKYRASKFEIIRIDEMCGECLKNDIISDKKDCGHCIHTPNCIICKKCQNCSFDIVCNSCKECLSCSEQIYYCENCETCMKCSDEKFCIDCSFCTGCSVKSICEKCKNCSDCSIYSNEICSDCKECFNCCECL
jgi:hypothetical protein